MFFNQYQNITDIYIPNSVQLTSNGSNLFRNMSNLTNIICNHENIVNMSNMFSNTGYSSDIFTLDLGDNFDTSNVTDMSKMFYQAGVYSHVFKLDCSGWDVALVVEYDNFNYDVEDKVIAPEWVNQIVFFIMFILIKI